MTIITISRGTFSGGKALAEQVAKKLGYPCLSREEAVHKAAEEYGITERDLETAFREPSRLWEQMPGKRIAYLKCITAIILLNAVRGNLVYHGHAGHLLLGDIARVLRVRVLADQEFRLKAAMESLSINREAAAIYIEKMDNERRKWSRFLYGIDWEDPNLYDVVLNLEKLSMDGACDIIARMSELPEFKMTAQWMRSLDDIVLSGQVWAALAKNESTRSAAIRVSCEDGVVTVEGSVGSKKTVEAISRVAGLVEGAKEIRNEVGIGTDWYW